MIDIIPQLIVNALISGSIYALAAMGLAMAYGLMKVLNFSHGHMMMVGAYVFYFFSAQLEMGIVKAAVCTALACGVLGWIFLQIFIIPFYRYGALITFLSTLCLATVLESLVSMIFGVNVKSLSGGSAAESIQIGEVYITPIQIAIIASALILLSFVAYLIHSTTLGLKVRAMAENPEAGEALGISRRWMSYGVFISSVLLAAYAGIMVGFETNMQPTMGGAYTIKAFAAMILGGFGNLWGSVIGSYILGFIENFAIGLDFGGYSIPAGYKDAFAFTIILVILLLKPEGLFGKRTRKV